MIRCGRGICKHVKCCLQQTVGKNADGNGLSSSSQQVRSLNGFIVKNEVVASVPCVTLASQRRDFELPKPFSGIHHRHISTQSRSQTFYYDVLGISPKASQAEIKSAYYRLSKLHHPDMDKKEGANVRFGQISEAYEILGNTRKRRMYDHGAFRGLRPTASHETHQEEEDYTRPFREQEGFGSVRQPPPTGRTQQYNFDEFYRQHYGEAVRQKQMDIEFMKQFEQQQQAENVQRKLRSFITGFTIFFLLAVFFGLDKSGTKSTSKK